MHLEREDIPRVYCSSSLHIDGYTHDQICMCVPLLIIVLTIVLTVDGGNPSLSEQGTW